MVVIGDGAPWTWNLAAEHFPAAVEIVDLYHAKEHVWDVAHAVLQFHHLDSEDKTFVIGKAVNRGFSLDRIKKEMQKCIVLCANCHAIRHYNMRKNNQTSPGIAGELEELNTLLAVSPEEEDAYNKQFGEGGDVE